MKNETSSEERAKNRAKFALFQLTVFHTSHKEINIIQRDGAGKNKTKKTKQMEVLLRLASEGPL